MRTAGSLSWSIQFFRTRLRAHFAAPVAGADSVRCVFLAWLSVWGAAYRLRRARFGSWAAYQPGFRPFLVRGDAWAYWTVYDGAYEPVEVADLYLRRVRFGSGMALGTTRMYAGNLALFFEFCVATDRSLRRAALELDRFMHYLVVTPIERRGRGQGQLRSRERVNHILVAVRELYREAVARGLLGGEVLQALFRVQRGFRLPAGVVEGQELSWHARPRHQLAHGQARASRDGGGGAVRGR